MCKSKPINLFYEEPDPDRWFKYDSFPRKLVRRLIRGKPKIGGVMMVALELMKGLDKLNIPYRFNDYKYAKNHPDELIGVIGKPQLIYKKIFRNPILFGAGIFSHPIECPDLFTKYPNIQKVLVPGEWMRKMFEPFYGERVITWPVGIDVKKWNPTIKKEQLPIDFLIYYKIRWDNERVDKELVQPIIDILNRQGKSYIMIRYGEYDHNELSSKLAECKAVLFFCEHETQGLAYQQILSTNTPILAWDKAEYWTDPFYYPERVSFKSVSSVPYWDERCGMKFSSNEDFSQTLNNFSIKLAKKEFHPREYVLENLTLEICAQKYYNIYQLVQNQLA